MRPVRAALTAAIGLGSHVPRVSVQQGPGGRSWIADRHGGTTWSHRPALEEMFDAEVKDRDGNPFATEASNGAQTAVIGAGHERGWTRGQTVGNWHMLTTSMGQCTARALRARAREAKPTPATKRISGPYLHAAGAPTKWARCGGPLSQSPARR